MDEVLERTKFEFTQTSLNTIKRLMLEFHTGGNIRVEEGKNTDLWYNSCIDLVHSRFGANSSAFRKLGIKGIRVNRITRIHNRFLRHRFEASVREIMEAWGNNLSPDNAGKNKFGNDDNDDNNNGNNNSSNSKGNITINSNSANASKVPKRMLEYLFYGISPKLTRQTGQADEIVRIAEDGFRTPQEYKSFGFDESVKLHSTIDGADMSRAEYQQEIGADKNSEPSHRASNPSRARMAAGSMKRPRRTDLRSCRRTE